MPASDKLGIYLSLAALRALSGRRIIAPMPLSDKDKADLRQQFQLLGEIGEPEAAIAAMQRAAQRKAEDQTIEASEARRWRILANALTEAEATVMAQQAPRKPNAHKDVEWSGKPQAIEASQLEKEYGRQGPPEPPSQAKPPETA